MLFASPKAANSSAGRGAGMRGWLIPADTRVTGQAPNRPTGLGEVAFAVTRSRPRGRGAGDSLGGDAGLTALGSGGPWVPGKG